jgi:hypothetical protein
MAYKQSFKILLIFYLLLLGVSSCNMNEPVAGEETLPLTPKTEAVITPEAVIEEPAPVVETILPVEEIQYTCGAADDVAIAEYTAQTYQVSTDEIMDYYC